MITLDQETIDKFNKMEFTGVTYNLYDKLSNIVFRHLVVNLLMPFKIEIKGQARAWARGPGPGWAHGLSSWAHSRSLQF